MSRKVDVDDLMGAAEIVREHAHVRTSVVHDWRRRSSPFPELVQRLGSFNLWRWSEVAAWIRRTGRLE